MPETVGRGPLFRSPFVLPKCPPRLRIGALHCVLPTAWKVLVLVASGERCRHGSHGPQVVLPGALTVREIARGPLVNHLPTMLARLRIDRSIPPLQGGECFGFFLQSGLDKAVLRDIWTVVAGAEGRLSQQQFVASMYLQEQAKRGAPLPKQLPPGAGRPSAGIHTHTVAARAAACPWHRGSRRVRPGSGVAGLPCP